MTADFRRMGPLLVASALVVSGCGDDGGPSATGSCAATGATPGAASGEPAAEAPATAAVEAAASAASAFLATLDSAQREAAVFDFTDLDGKRCSWSNFPVQGFDGRQGVRMGDLTEPQQAAALAAVAGVLSDAGAEQAEGIRAADDFLGSSDSDDDFSSGNYWLALYGEPSTSEPWTLQFGGHHLAVHVSVGSGALSASPYFSGVEPVAFEYEGTQYDPLSSQAGAVFDLVGSLDADQRSAAELSGSFDDIVMGPGVDTGYPAQEGLPYDELTSEQQQLVQDAIAAWVGDVEPLLSEPLIALYTSQLSETTIGWSGSTSIDETAYVRIDGPRLWIEHQNAEGDDGVHYHTIYRDKELDYGTGVGAG